MDIAALIAWIVTALGGAYLLRTWIANGGVRQQPAGTSRLPAPLVFGHFLLAAAGLVVWIIYLAVDKTAFAWTGFVLLVLVALLGFTMFVRWLPTRRVAGAGGQPATGDTDAAERHFPVPVVAAHGLLAVATVVLVLLSALGIGGS